MVNVHIVPTIHEFYGHAKVIDNYYHNNIMMVSFVSYHWGELKQAHTCGEPVRVNNSIYIHV